MEGRIGPDTLLDSLKRFFEERVAPDVAHPSPETRDKALRLAAAALLFEVVRADDEVKDEERTVMRAAIQSKFALSREEAEDLARLAEERSRSATSLYELTHVVDQELSAEQKKRLVELLWLIAFADAEKDPREEQVVRRIAGLLHVPHPDFIDAKIRAREESGGHRTD
jgi:uncharacterized tellurite resistance protein B-like protein